MDLFGHLNNSINYEVIYGGSDHNNEAPHNFSLHFWNDLIGFTKLSIVSGLENLERVCFLCFNFQVLLY